MVISQITIGQVWRLVLKLKVVIFLEGQIQNNYPNDAAYCTVSCFPLPTAILYTSLINRCSTLIEHFPAVSRPSALAARQVT